MSTPSPSTPYKLSLTGTGAGSTYHKQAADVIDTLEPFRVTELKRP